MRCCPRRSNSWNNVEYIDEQWVLKPISLATFNLCAALMTGKQLCSIVDEVVNSSTIAGSKKISIHSCISNKKASVKFACSLLTNYAWSVRCVFRALALQVNDSFENGMLWQNFLYHFNKITWNFNFHSKAKLLLKRELMESTVTQNCINRLMNDIATWLHSRLGVLLTYLADYDNI